MRGVEVHECERGVETHVGVWRQMCVRGVWRCMCVRGVEMHVSEGCGGACVEVHVCQKGVDCFLKRHRRGFCEYVLFVCVTFVCVTSVLLPLTLLFDMHLWTSQITCIMIQCLSVPPPLTPWLQVEVVYLEEREAGGGELGDDGDTSNIGKEEALAGPEHCFIYSMCPFIASPLALPIDNNLLPFSSPPTVTPLLYHLH